MNERATANASGRNGDSMGKAEVELYKRSVRKHFSFLKSIDDPDTLLAHSIEFPKGNGRLTPICALNAASDELIRKLALWRKENAHAFPTQFTVTVPGTASWIRERILGVEDRMLFLVEDAKGDAVGHIGFADCINDNMNMEIDNVVRGISGISPGIMSASLRALIGWAEERIRPQVISLRVFSDNGHAIEYYKRCGFVERDLLPLRCHREKDNISYLPVKPDDDEPPDKYFRRMIYSEHSERKEVAG
jgi:perosamine synthetase